MSIVTIESTSPTMDRTEPTIVKISKPSATAAEGSGAFTFCTKIRHTLEFYTEHVPCTLRRAIANIVH